MLYDAYIHTYIHTHQRTSGNQCQKPTITNYKLQVLQLSQVNSGWSGCVTLRAGTLIMESAVIVVIKMIQEVIPEMFLLIWI